jgi:hypothetical protein
MTSRYWTEFAERRLRGRATPHAFGSHTTRPTPAYAGTAARARGVGRLQRPSWYRVIR